MKKIISFLIIVILLTGCSLNLDRQEDYNDNNKEEKEETSNGIDYAKDEVGRHEVTLTLFHSNSCGHCFNLKQWLETIKDQYPYLKIEMYEASENYNLYIKVKNKIGASDGVPLTIIGNDYILGYSEDLRNEYIDYIKKNSTYESCNIVDAIKNNKDVDECMKKNK